MRYILHIGGKQTAKALKTKNRFKEKEIYYGTYKKILIGNGN